MQEVTLQLSLVSRGQRAGGGGPGQPGERQQECQRWLVVGGARI